MPCWLDETKYEVDLYCSGYIYTSNYNEASEFISDYIYDNIEEDKVQIITSTDLTELPDDFGAISKTSTQDYDQDGLSDWEEINVSLLLAVSKKSNVSLITVDNIPTYGEYEDYLEDTNADNKLFYVSGGTSRFLQENNCNPISSLRGIPILPINSDPLNEDGDGDGIKDGEKDNDGKLIDTAPLEKGIYNDEIDDIVIGNLTIVSCSNAPVGHAFLVYQSYINDTIDLTELTGGYEFGTWNSKSPCEYTINRSDYIAIGNAGAGAEGGSSQPFESSSTGLDGDKAGVFFNREFANEMKNYKDNAGSKEFKQYYDQNESISKPITEINLKRIINNCSTHNYYNLLTNNCAIVAANSWNLVSNDIKFNVKVLPNSLKKQISKYEGHKQFDMYTEVFKIAI